MIATVINVRIGFKDNSCHSRLSQDSGFGSFGSNKKIPLKTFVMHCSRGNKGQLLLRVNEL